MRPKEFSNIGDKLDFEKLYKSKRKINKIIVHCTATPKGRDYDAHSIDRMHINRDFAGIGYHYLVLNDGSLERGRWVDAVGAHAAGNNLNTIGIAYVGGVDNNIHPLFDAMTPAQHDTLIQTLVQLIQLYGLKSSDILGHNELPKVAKACPCLTMAKIREEVLNVRH